MNCDRKVKNLFEKLINVTIHTSRTLDGFYENFQEHYCAKNLKKKQTSFYINPLVATVPESTRDRLAAIAPQNASKTVHCNIAQQAVNTCHSLPVGSQQIIKEFSLTGMFSKVRNVK